MECYLPFPRRTGGGSTGECWRADTGRFTGASGYLRAVLALAKRPSLLRHTGSGCPPHPRHRANEAKGGTLRPTAGSLENALLETLAMEDSKNWLALNASGLAWLALTFGIMVFAGALGTVP
jgi:hypothetical protein